MPIGPLIAAEEATRSLDRMRIEGHPDAAAISADGHAGVPAYVSRIDVQGQDYYLVPWQGEHGIEVIVRIDAPNGVMSSMVVLPTPLEQLVLDPAEASRIAAAAQNTSVIGEPHLVWRACRESASPFQPLYQVPIEGGSVFVGMDGSVYRALTPFGKGG